MRNGWMDLRCWKKAPSHTIFSPSSSTFFSSFFFLLLPGSLPVPSVWKGGRREEEEEEATGVHLVFFLNGPTSPLLSQRPRQTPVPFQTSIYPPFLSPFFWRGRERERNVWQGWGGSCSSSFSFHSPFSPSLSRRKSVGRRGREDCP